MKFFSFEDIISKTKTRDIDRYEKLARAELDNYYHTDQYNPAREVELLCIILTCMVKKDAAVQKNEMGILHQLRKKAYEAETVLRKAKNHTKTGPIMYEIYLKSLAQRLGYIESIYNLRSNTLEADVVLVIRRDMERIIAHLEKRKSEYVRLTLMKIFSDYGTSFKNVGIFSFIVIGLFSLIFLVSDMTTQPYVGGDGVQTIDYYLYISLCTFSNLGADTSMAANLFLRIIFGIEQIAGVLAAGVIISLLSRKL